jgi:cell division septal protein FtsQ
MAISAALAATCALAVLYLGALSWGWLRQRFLYHNRAFTLDTIEVQTDGAISPDQARRWAGVNLGDNLLSLNLARVKRDLELVPQVESATVERVLPHLLRLQVRERQPVAQVRLLRYRQGDWTPATYYLDPSGVVMPPLPPSGAAEGTATSAETLPLLAGVGGHQVRAGQVLASPPARAALRLLADFDRSPMAGQVDLRSVDVAFPGILLVTTEQGNQVTLGVDHLAAQLERWRLVHEAGLKLGKAVASLDLSLSNNCPVLWQEASALPLPKPKPHKPQLAQRKHV